MIDQQPSNTDIIKTLYVIKLIMKHESEQVFGKIVHFYLKHIWYMQ